MKIKLFIWILFLNIFFLQTLSANPKENIIKRLEDTNTIEFSFIQTTNEEVEKGNCILFFPKKLNCSYKNKNQKRLIINKNQMAIIQERYDKKYFYPLKETYFSKIFDKKGLIDFINSSSTEIKDNKINLINLLEKNKRLIILFDKKTFDLNGWVIKDQLNNKVSFLISIKSRNIPVDAKIFKIPSIN